MSKPERDTTTPGTPGVDYRRGPKGSENEEYGAIAHWDLVRRRHPALTPVHALQEAYPRAWLIEGVQQVGSLALTFGPSGAGKTFYALDKALCIATLSDYHGREMPGAWESVVYICGEGNEGLPGRVNAWFEYYKIPCPVDDTLFFAWTRPVNFLDRDAVDRLLEAFSLASVHPVLIIIDTLAVNVGPSFNENEAGDVGALISNLNYIREKLSYVSIEIIHHTGKGDTKNPRGSSALLAAMDTAILVQKSGDGIRVSCTKQKDGPPFEDVEFDLIEVDYIDTSEAAQLLNKKEVFSSLVPVLRNPLKPTKNPVLGQTITKPRRAGLEVAKALEERFGDDTFTPSDFSGRMAKNHNIVKQTSGGVRSWLVEQGVLAQPSEGLLKIGPEFKALIRSENVAGP